MDLRDLSTWCLLASQEESFIRSMVGFPKVLNHKTKTHSDSINQYQKPTGWGQVPGWGRSEKADRKPEELRNPMFHRTHEAFKKP